MGPSLSELRFMLETDQVVDVTVAANGPAAVVPSETLTVTVAPASTVPEAEVLALFPLLTGLVTVVVLTLGTTVSLFAVFESFAVFVAASVAVTEYVTLLEPSASVLTFLPENDQLPEPS